MEIIVGHKYVISNQSKKSSKRCHVCLVPINQSNYDGYQIAVGKKGKKNHTINCNPYFCIRCVLAGKIKHKIKVSEDQIKSFVNSLKMFSEPITLTVP